MAMDQTLVDIFDETIEALSNLDLERLDALERRIVLLAESNGNFARDSIGLVLAEETPTRNHASELSGKF